MFECAPACDESAAASTRASPVQGPVLQRSGVYPDLLRRPEFARPCTRVHRTPDLDEDTGLQASDDSDIPVPSGRWLLPWPPDFRVGYKDVGEPATRNAGCTDKGPCRTTLGALLLLE